MTSSSGKLCGFAEATHLQMLCHQSSSRTSTLQGGLPVIASGRSRRLVAIFCSPFMPLHVRAESQTKLQDALSVVLP
jgi:hypothetical protein